MKPYSERLPLIDEAIDYLEGIWPLEGFNYLIEARRNVGWACGIPFNGYLCTRQEFEQRVKERNSMKEYEYMKEYECNGEKPDLPDDVEVQIRDKNWDNIESTSVPVWKWDWPNVKSFRIVDERWKTENKNDWYEKDELPPVGIKCEYLDGVSSKWIKVWTVASHAFDQDAILFCKDKKTGFVCYGYSGSFRPLRTKEDDLVDACVKVLGGGALSGSVKTLRDQAALLVKAGWRPTEKKDD